MNVFRSREGTVIAVCDDDLLGNTFREGKLKLEVKEGFYGGRRSSMAEAMEAVGAADVANLVGSRTVSAAIEKGYADPQAVIRIGGVPHLQIVRLGAARSRLLREPAD